MVKHLLPPGYYLTAIFSLSLPLLGFIKPLHSLSPDLKAGLLRQWLLQLPQFCFMIMSTALCVTEIMTSLILIVMSLTGCSFVHSSNHTTSSHRTSDTHNCSWEHHRELDTPTSTLWGGMLSHESLADSQWPSYRDELLPVFLLCHSQRPLNGSKPATNSVWVCLWLITQESQTSQ